MGVHQNTDFRRLIASSFDWWHEAGLDQFVDDAPRDWLAPPVVENAPSAAAPTAANAEPVAAPALPSLPDTLAAFEAWRISAAAPDAAWNPVIIAPQGNAGSDLMFLIEMPERDDEASGALLSGAAGRLFDRMLAAIGRDRSSIYLASLAVARPASGRIPPEVIEELAPIARHHVALAAPKRLMVIGNAASRAILGTDIAPARGSLHRVNHDDAKTVPGAGTARTEVVASYHPRFLLERPQAKAEAWRDLQLLVKGI